MSSCTQLVTAVQEIVDYTRTTNLGTTGSICSLKGAAGKAYTIVLICGGSYSDCPDPVVGAAPLFLNAEVSITVAADSKCKNGAARPVLSQGGYDTSNGPVADSYLFGLGRAVISGDPNSCARLNTDTTKAILGGALKLDSIVLDGRGVTGGVIAAAAKKVCLRFALILALVCVCAGGLRREQGAPPNPGAAHRRRRRRRPSSFPPPHLALAHHLPLSPLPASAAPPFPLPHNEQLELKNVDVRNMVSSVGAGLLVTDTPLTISKVAFSACAADDGAAIFYLSQNLPTPSLAANNVVFNDNTAQNECAALLIASSGAVKFSPAISAACRGCTFVGNRGNAANGGAEFGSVTEGGLICASRAGSDSTNTKQAPRSELALDLSGSNFFGACARARARVPRRVQRVLCAACMPVLRACVRACLCASVSSCAVRLVCNVCACLACLRARVRVCAPLVAASEITSSQPPRTPRPPTAPCLLLSTTTTTTGNKPLIGVIFGTGFLPFRRARVVGVNSQQLAKVKLDPLPKTW